MTPRSKPDTPRKRINLALQGGGAHGAFTWGVIDRLLEDGRIDIEGISGTSAGAMNAAVLAYGLATGGHQGGRDALADFWHRTSEAARLSPLRPSPMDRWFTVGNMDLSPSWMLYDNMSRVLSPYQFNPTNINPLRDVVAATIDFDILCETDAVKLFLCATNVRTGRIKIFKGRELSVDAVLASACLPFLFHAVHVDGEDYWDGGYMGNPPLYPLIYHTDCNDVLLVQINPVGIDQVPRSARSILDRINTLSFNSSLMREMRAISFVTKLIDEGSLDGDRYKRLNIHAIDAEPEMAKLSVSSKLNADQEFLGWLFRLGRDRAAQWLDSHFDKINKETSTDIAQKFL
ncbi:MAG: patatin-like phospholipase family protein [Inquilinaceae bacterium]